MKRLTLLVCLLIYSGLSGYAQTVITIEGATPGSSTIFIENGGTLYVKGGIDIQQAGSSPADFDKYLQNNGTIQIVSNPGAGQSDFSSDVAGLQTYTTGQTTGEVIFAADNETQSITGSGSTEFMSLEVNNVLPPTVTLSQDVTVNGTLTIGGVIKTQSNNLTLASSGSLAGSPFSTTNMIQADGTGKFIRGLGVIGSSTSFTFPIGDATPNYTPVVLTFASNSSAGTVGINVKNTTQPNNNTPSVPGAYLSRYWTFSNTGLTNYSYTGTFTYPSANIVGTESALRLSRWTGASWFEHSGSTAASNLLTITSSLNQTTAPLSGDFTGRRQTVPTCNMNGGSATPSFSIICTSTTKTLTTDGSGGTFQWQSSTDNVTWSDISGETNSSYTTPTGSVLGGAGAKIYYRALVKNINCYSVSSTTAVVDVSSPTFTINSSNITDSTFVLDWTPVGSGNYNITYTGTTSGSIPNATSPVTLGNPTPLPANGTYNVTITQTGVSGCSASGTKTVSTLCDAPLVSAPSVTTHAINLSWTGPTANYRIYWRGLYSSGINTMTVTNATTATITKLNNNVLPGGYTYEVYVSRLDCPTGGAVGQLSNKLYVTTPPLSTSCTDIPVIDDVTSTCPSQIEVTMHGSSQYQVYIQRLTPTIQPVNSYGVSGGYFTANIGSAGQNYLIAVAARCGSSIGNLVVWPGVLQVKPQCAMLNNLVLSNPTCHGFTASWNTDPCQSNILSSYQLYLRVQGTLIWNSYPVIAPATFRQITWLTSNRNYEAYVRSNYACNGFLAWGPASHIQTMSTLTSGCREDEPISGDESIGQQLSSDKIEALSLYPNPSNGQFEVNLSSINTDEKQVRVEVLNLVGQTILTHLTTISNGYMNEFIHLPQSAASGTYLVKVTAGTNVYNTKINISR